jgi:hypothetical protein
MIQQTQVKINLPVQLKKLIKNQADLYGYTLAGYFRYLAVKQIEDTRWFPVKKMSKRTESNIEKAFVNNKWIEIDNVGEYFDKLK